MFGHASSDLTTADMAMRQEFSKVSISKINVQYKAYVIDNKLLGEEHLVNFTPFWGWLWYLSIFFLFIPYFFIITIILWIMYWFSISSAFNEYADWSEEIDTPENYSIDVSDYMTKHSL